MFFTRWITDLTTSLQTDLGNFKPELLLCATIVLLLILRLFNQFNRLHLGAVALGFTIVALLVSLYQWQALEEPTAEAERMFSGLLIYDNFTVFLRIFLLGFVALVIWL